MKTRVEPFKKEECRRLVALFKPGLQPLKCGYFANLHELNLATKAFQDEVTDNVYGMKPRENRLYLNWILREFREITFTVNSTFIEMKLKKYDENYTSFPNFKNQELITRLSRDLTAITAAQLKMENLDEVYLTKDLQQHFLNFSHKLKFEEINEFLAETFKHTGDSKDMKFLEKNAPVTGPSVKIEKQLFRLLQQHTKPFVPQENKSMSAAGLLSQIRQKEEQLIDLWEEMATGEIGNNLFFLERGAAIAYLHHLEKQFDKLDIAFAQKEILLLDPEKIDLNDPERYPREEDREQLVAAIRSLNDKSQLCVAQLTEYVQERRSCYFEQTGLLKELRELTSNQLVLLCDRTPYMDLEAGPNTRIAKFLHLLTTNNEKNLKNALEKLDSVTPGNITKQYQADIDKVDEIIKKWFS